MKKVLTLMVAALLVTGASYAFDGGKKCSKDKKCCTKGKCSKDKAKGKTTTVKA